MSVSVRLLVCSSASLSPELHVRSSTQFLCMLHMAVAPSFSGRVAICCVFPVLWVTSYLDIKGHMGDVNVVAASDVIASSCVGYSVPGESYWLRPVLDDGGRRV